MDASLAGRIIACPVDLASRAWVDYEDGLLQSFLVAGTPLVGLPSVQSMLASNADGGWAPLGSAGLATPGCGHCRRRFSASWCVECAVCAGGRCHSRFVIKPTDGGSRWVFRRRMMRSSCVVRLRMCLRTAGARWLSSVSRAATWPSVVI